VLKDYCGIVNEESIRKNFTLVYEIMDELVVCRASIIKRCC